MTGHALCVVFVQTGNEFMELYDEQVHELSMALMESVNPNGYGEVCYDATWALALALNRTISGKLGCLLPETHNPITSCMAIHHFASYCTITYSQLLLCGHYISRRSLFCSPTHVYTKRMFSPYGLYLIAKATYLTQCQ